MATRQWWPRHEEHLKERNTMKTRTVDLAVIGSGGAAFGATLRASELGASVAVIERGTLGGTCVNIGCVPSKTLLRAAEALHRAKETPFAGIKTSASLTDFAAVIGQKDDLVGALREQKYAGVLSQIPNAELISGHARFTGPGRLRVGEEEVVAKSVLIATGARSWQPAIPGLSDVGFLTSTSAMDLKKLPQELIVIGGRYIALEQAQIFSRLGAKVTVLQRSGRILADQDPAITDPLTEYLEAEGLNVQTSVRINSVRRDGDVCEVLATVAGEDRIFRANAILVATGRRANTHDLGLETIGAEVSDTGTLLVDDYLQTSEANVYGAGDVIGNPSFVYTAAQEGKLVAENALSGVRQARSAHPVPWVVFTDPQVAGVGLTEAEARIQGFDVSVAHVPMSMVPRAIAARDPRGLIQLVRDSATDKLLGATILAPEAGDLVMEPTLAIRYGIPVAELASMLHPYLTQSEGIKLAAQSFVKDLKNLSCCAA